MSDIQEPITGEVLGGAARGNISYIGLGMSVAKFEEYVTSYDFGKYKPTFVVLHHTIMPDTQQARFLGGVWDADDYSRSEPEVYAHRLKHLGAIKTYYETEHPDWPAGPHLFVDDRYVWLFSPMNAPGVHAMEGNGRPRSYSIGIEVVGYYEHVTWPEDVADNVRRVVLALQAQLKTFELVHKKGPGGISAHRDYNKPECPGAKITTEYYMGVITKGTKSAAAATYLVTANLKIRQQPRTVLDDGRTPVPTAGMVKYNETVLVDKVLSGEKVIDTDQWGHLADGRGFVTMRYLRKKSQ
jgi:hypothetical protein